MSNTENLYRPSNGTEGCDFQDHWCCRCERDAKFSYDNPELGCQILADTYAYDITDPKYPKEWTYDKKTAEPCCTAFVERGKDIPCRCDKTIDLFS